MSLTDSEIMGGVGFGDDEYSFYNYSEDISHLINEGRKKTDPFDRMMSGEELSYVKHNPRIENSQFVYTNRAEMRGRPEPHGREFARGSIPEDLDNSDTVNRYLFDRVSGQRHAPYPKRFTPPEPKPGIGEKFLSRSQGFANGAMEKFEGVVQDTFGENTVSMLLTIIFVLIIALVVLQIMNARRMQKLIKSIMKNIPRPIFVSSHVEKAAMQKSE
jgi:hypothetical protein